MTTNEMSLVKSFGPDLGLWVGSRADVKIGGYSWVGDIVSLTTEGDSFQVRIKATGEIHTVPADISLFDFVIPAELTFLAKCSLMNSESTT